MEKGKAHLEETGWSYWKHLHHSIVQGRRLISIAMVGFVHGLFPGWRPGYAPIEIYRLYKDMKQLRHVQKLYNAEDKTGE
jgi:hypothetical protein